MEFVHYLAKIPPIVSSLIGVIVSLFLFFSIRYTRSLRPIGKNLETVSKVLKAFKSPMTGNKLEELKDQFSGLPYFTESWEEFRETLVLVTVKDGSEVVYNTRRANEFINPESLIEHHLNVYWYQSFPTVLTGLGLVGTFTAILFGLNALRVDPVSGQVAHIDEFINSLSGKFSSSIVGLSAAMLFLAIEKYQLGALNNRCVKIEQQLDRLFPQRVTEEILADMLKHLEEQSNNFRHFGSELADHMKQSFQESIVPTMDRLATAIDQMLVAAENLQKQKEESAASVIEKIASSFHATLNEHASQEIARLASSLEETASFAENMNTRVGDLLSHSEGLLTTQQQQSTEQMNAMKETVERILAGVDANLIRQQEMTNKQIEEIGRTFASLTHGLEESNTAFIDSIRTSVADMITKNREWSEEFHERFKLSLAQQSEFNSDLQGKIAESIDSALSGLKASFEEHLQSANQSIESVIAKLRDWSKSTSEELVGYAGSLSKQTEVLAHAGESVKQAAVELENSFKDQKTFLLEVSSVGTSIKEASDNLSESTNSLGTIHKASDEALKRIMEQVNKSDSVMAELEKLLDQQRLVYTTLDETVGRTLSVVNSAVREYSEHTRESLGEHLTTFDKHLADAANQLHGTVSDLEEHLGELSEMLERTVAAASAAGR